MSRLSTDARFMKYVEKDGAGGCWNWTGGISDDGYGNFWMNNKTVRAHRYSFVRWNKYGLTFDDIEGGVVCHDCDNPLCINPDHLWIGTCDDNSKDMKLKNRAATGEKHGCAKLTVEDVLEIRNRYSRRGITQIQLSNEYGISNATISDIINRNIWKHI